ncbi:MAG: response regulator transcription factor [Negativicutes bacterium]|nr:response regulator transcription factor [Negativicutes bacterium]
MERILVADDDANICRIVRQYLEGSGFVVKCAADGQEALAAAMNEDWAMLILDYMMPKVDGLEVMIAVKEKKPQLPVIVLTARDEEGDRIEGLTLGADDYIGKPFSPRELVARVRTVLRRYSRQPLPVIRVIERGDLRIDRGRHLVGVAGRDIEFTDVEMKIICLLAEYPGRVFSRLQIIENVYGHAFDGFERAVDAHIKNIRRKLGDDFKNPKYIATVYGAGYKYVDN